MKKKTDQPEECSNLKSITDISQSYKSKADLSEEVKNLRAVVGAQELDNKLMLEQLKKKDQEIEELKKLLAHSPKNLSIGTINEELMIAEMQLNKLRVLSQNRELTLEEARKFEIFSKVKQANSNNAMDVPYKKSTSDKETAELLKLAQKSVKKVEHSDDL